MLFRIISAIIIVFMSIIMVTSGSTPTTRLIRCSYAHDQNFLHLEVGVVDRFVHEVGFDDKGNKQLIHIEDIQNFSEVDDYIVLENNKGYRITYPLKCRTFKIR